MKFLVTVRPASPPPLEMTLPLLMAFRAWREKFKGTMDSFYFFSSGQGGCGVVNANDAADLLQMMTEYPFSNFSTITTEALVDGDQALAQVTATVQAMMQQMSGKA